MAQKLCSMAWLRKTDAPAELPADAPPIRVVDLFCGCGGMSLGVSEAARAFGRRYEIAFAIDLSPTAVSVFTANFAKWEASVHCSSITDVFPGALGEPATVEEKRIAECLGNIDLIVAGPPCQGHSDLNNSTRRNDPRNLLYLRAIRTVELLRPKAVIIENVPAVIHDKGSVVQRGEEVLAKLGYTYRSGIVDAVQLGLPQKRRRHLLIAAKQPKLNCSHLFRKRKAKPTPVALYLRDLLDETTKHKDIFNTSSRCTEANKSRIQFLFKKKLYDLPNVLRPACHRDKPHTYKSMYGRIRWNEPCGTITSGFGSMGQGRFVHPLRERMITPHEAARIQGFPEFFDFSSATRRGELQELIGNAVPPRIAANAVRVLFKQKVFD